MDPRLEAAFAALPHPQDDTEALRLAIARGLLHGYHDRWKHDQWQVDAVEEEFHLPILNPTTGRKTPLFTHAGKRDGRISRDGQRFLLEHKTCREDISPGSWYWRRLHIDSQISGYMLAARQQGQSLNGVLYDVIRKPEIRPRVLGLSDTSKLRATSTYFGRPLSPASYQQFSLDLERRETAEMFEARLAQDATERPAWYFARREVVRLDRDLLTFAHELWQSARDVQQARRTGDIRRNDAACFMFSQPCPYLDLCAEHDQPDSPRWRSLATLHPELEDPTCGPRTLTNSRLRTFATCRRKHHYRYELGLGAPQESEALTFGSLFHAALAAWWQTSGDERGAETGEVGYRNVA